jgi:hypothetical protein
MIEIISEKPPQDFVYKKENLGSKEKEKVDYWKQDLL